MEQALEFIKTNTYAHFAVVGFVVGLLARVIMPGPDPMGLIATTLLGMAGSLLSGYLISTYNLSIPISAPWNAYVASFVGAFLILSVFKVIRNIG